MKDFGDGPGGAVYQHQLNVFVRYLYKIGAQDALDNLHLLGHNIRDILEQIIRVVQYMEKDSFHYNTLDQVEAAAVLDEEREDRDSGARMAVRLRESLRCSVRRDARGAARESANTYIRTGQMGVKMRRRAVQPGEAWRGESSRGVAR